MACDCYGFGAPDTCTAVDEAGFGGADIPFGGILDDCPTVPSVPELSECDCYGFGAPDTCTAVDEAGFSGADIPFGGITDECPTTGGGGEPGGGPGTITGEIHSIDSSDSFILGNENVIESTVVITNPTGTETYIEGVDYILVSSGGFTEVQWIGASVPSTVIVNYQYLTDGPGTEEPDYPGYPGYAECNCHGYGGRTECDISDAGFGGIYAPWGGESVLCAPNPETPDPIIGTLKVKYTTDFVNTATLPLRYQNVVIRGLRGLINDNNRYVMRFTRDFTLRDNLDFGKTPLDLKNAHEEWKLFREKQEANIDRYLWDKITESLIGYKLDSPTTRVPSLERELYDTRYDRSTRRGIGNNQAFVDDALAKEAILSDLNDPDNDFYPIDMDLFLNTYTFETPDNIIEAMDTIYTKFDSSHVNRIFFKVLHAAFTDQNEYADIMKTSWIAIRVSELLNKGGKIGG